MALITQFVDDEGELLPLVLPSATQRLTPTALPVVQVLHRGSISVNAPGAGNTGKLVLRLALPGNWLFVLQRFNASMLGITSNVWKIGSFIVTPALNQDETVTNLNQIHYPVGSLDVTGTGQNRRFYTMGALADNATYQQTGINGPDIALYGRFGSSLDPALQLEEDVAGLLTTYGLTYYFLWNGYPLEQGLSSEFHASIPNFSR